MNEVTISAAELIQLTNRIRRLENTLVRIATLAEPDGFETEELNAIWCLAVEATDKESLTVGRAITEECSVDQKEVQA